MVELKHFTGDYKPPLGDNWEELMGLYISQIEEITDDPVSNLGKILTLFADRDRYMDFQEFDVFCKMFQVSWYKDFENGQKLPFDIRSYSSTCKAIHIINTCLSEEGWLYKVRIYENQILKNENKPSHGDDYNNHWYRVERL